MQLVKLGNQAQYFSDVLSYTRHIFNRGKNVHVDASCGFSPENLKLFNSLYSMVQISFNRQLIRLVDKRVSQTDFGYLKSNLRCIVCEERRQIPKVSHQTLCSLA